MDIRQLKVLRTMLRAGSVSETARTIHVTQPAVSKTLASIEAELKMSLFERINGRVVPTVHAHALCAEIDRILGDFANLYQTARELREGRQGHIRIAAAATLAGSMVPAAIAVFKRGNPQVEFTVTVASTSEIIELVEHNQVDIGLCQPPTRSTDVQRTDLCRASVICVMPASHRLSRLKKISPPDLMDDDLIGFGLIEPTGDRIAKAFLNEGLQYRLKIETNQTFAACALVNAGLGVALVDSFLMVETIFPALVSRPFWPKIELRIEVMTSHHRTLSPIAHAFFNQLTADAARSARRR